MSNEIVPQAFESQEFGTIRAMRGEDGEPWFVAKDVCDALGLGRQQDSTRYLDDDERGECLVNTPSGEQRMVTVSEAGLYSLVLKSRKPEAKRFKRWVTHEVLPAIRRHGAYATPRTIEDIIADPRSGMRLLQALADEQDRNRELEAKVAEQAPKAGMFDACMDGERWMSVTEVSRLLHQYDRTITRNRLFELMTHDGIITRDRQASKEGIDRGYVVNYQPPACFNQKTGEAMRPKPYAKVTSKGLDWALRRYCGRGVA